MTSWRQPSSAPVFAGSIARLACRPVLKIAISTHGSTAMTTVIMMRLRSIASRTCAAVFVTEAGE